MDEKREKRIIVDNQDVDEMDANCFRDGVMPFFLLSIFFSWHSVKRVTFIKFRRMEEIIWIGPNFSTLDPPFGAYELVATLLVFISDWE